MFKVPILITHIAFFYSLDGTSSNELFDLHQIALLCDGALQWRIFVEIRVLKRRELVR